MLCIWVRSRNCDCLVTWSCYRLIARPGNKTVTVSWPDPYDNDRILTHSWNLYLKAETCKKITHQPPTHRQPIVNQSPTNHRPSQINRQPVVTQSPTGRRLVANFHGQFWSTSRQLVGDLSPTDCQLICEWKMTVLVAQRLHWYQMFFGRKAVADRSQHMCDLGLNDHITTEFSRVVSMAPAVLSIDILQWPITSQWLCQQSPSKSLCHTSSFWRRFVTYTIFIIDKVKKKTTICLFRTRGTIVKWYKNRCRQTQMGNMQKVQYTWII